jgi:hypothetical protein
MSEMRNTRMLVAGLSWLLLSAGLGAQVRVGPFPPGRGQGVGGRATAVPADQAGMVAIEPLEATRPVTGAPYKAEAVTETSQVLADGNSIGRRTSAVIARDSRGRIRREQPALALGGLLVDGPLVTITDPAARTHVTLDRERKVAVRVTLLPDDPAPAPAGASDGATVKEEALGERDIEGVRAEGTRTTMTIPANAIGNRAPITAVSERWFSSDLQAVVLTRRSDPRFGETVYRLVNIVRAEPPTALFEIPADYRIDERILRRSRPPVRE